MNCDYIRSYYQVPAYIGRRVIVYGEPGIIAADRGNYIGVNLDKDKPGVIDNYHPTDGVEYLGMGKIRKASKGRERYLRYLEYGDGFDSFLDYCRWDAGAGRSWNL